MKYRRQVVESFNYVSVIEKALENNGQKVGSTGGKHNILLSQHMQILQEKKILKNAGMLSTNQGIGRVCHNGTLVDKFILTRKAISMCELIFNQNSNLDFHKHRRFFDLDQELKWKLNDCDKLSKESCYICEKQQYCIIFYQRDKSLYMNNDNNINQELVQIKDSAFIAKLRQEYKV